MSTPSTVQSIAPIDEATGRVAVTLSSGGQFTVRIDTLRQLGLVVGQPVAADVQETLVADARALGVFDRAARLLETHDHTCADLRAKLLQKGEPEALVDAALERLQALGVLDDVRFAAHFARQAVRERRWALSRVRETLQAKHGVPSAAVARGITRFAEEQAAEGADAGLLQEDPEVAGGNPELLAAAQKRLKALAKYPARVQARRLASWLARRGHDEEAVLAVVASLTGVTLAGAEGDDGEDPSNQAGWEDDPERYLH